MMSVLNLVYLIFSTMTGSFATEIWHLSPQDYEFLNNLPSHRAALPAGFKYKYVVASGSIHDLKPDEHVIEVAASPKVSERGHYDAALVVSHVIRHMPSSIFTHLATRSSVGVFSRTEKLTIYPQYYSLANTPECHKRCDGNCKRTCTLDGRKWENLAGLGGTRALILEDNVMCSSLDPYHHHENILVHEFAHTIHHHGLNVSMSNKVMAAYKHAQTNRLWTNSAYAMSNYEEYFAEATTSWYNANQQRSAGGMNMCGTHYYCSTVSQAREYMHKHDPQLYDILNYVYNNGKAYLPGEITTCIEQAK